MTPAKGYMEMKDSGIEWVGMIPAHWGICKIKYTVTQETLRAENNGGYIGLENVESWSGKIIDKHNENVVVEGASLAVCPNDILFGKLRPYLAKCAIAEKSGCCSTELIVMRPHSIEGRFLKYVMLTPQFIDMVNMSTYGAKMPRANWDFIGNALLAMPSRDEQAAIASYLDTQCAKIDEIIAQAKASMEDYKQWKASIIYEAVTKGLDPNVEMKDSGIEWIGKVPMRWKIVRLKYLLSTPLQYGANETGLPYDESLPRYIRITDITLDGKLKTSGMQSLSEEKSEGYILDDEDILLARSGATVGKAFYYRESYGKAAFAGYLIRAKINSAKALPKFIYYSTMSAGYEKWKETAVIQATIQNIGASRYNEYSLAIPPIAEQLRIIEFLDDKMEKIDSLMAEKQSLIGDLESYKKSLIYEVVTGKRRV